MQPKIFCQSCTMPIDDIAMRGTEKDGTTSSEYCKYCYEKGAFISPGMTLDQMKEVVNGQMEKMHIPANIIKLSIDTLPHLKRWQKKNDD